MGKQNTKDTNNVKVVTSWKRLIATSRYEQNQTSPVYSVQIKTLSSAGKTKLIEGGRANIENVCIILYVQDHIYNENNKV